MTPAALADFNALGQVLGGELARRHEQQKNENTLQAAMQLLLPQPPGRAPRAPMNGFGNGISTYNNNNGNYNGGYNSGYANGNREC